MKKGLQNEEFARFYRDTAPCWLTARYAKLEEAATNSPVELLARWVEFGELILRAVAWTRIAQSVAHDPSIAEGWLVKFRDRPTLGGLTHWIADSERQLEERGLVPWVAAGRAWQDAAAVLTAIRNQGYHAELDAALERLETLRLAVEVLAESFVSVCLLRFGWFQRMPLSHDAPLGWVESTGGTERGRANRIHPNAELLVHVPALVNRDGDVLWLSPFFHVDDLGRLWTLSHVESASQQRVKLHYTRLGEPKLVRQVDAANVFGGLIRSAVEPATMIGKPQPMRLPDGLLVRYEILREIGHGGEGRVYAVHDHALARPLAMKSIRPNSDDDKELWRQRVMRGARALAHLRHPGVVVLHDCVETADYTVYLLQEFVDGLDLAAWRQRSVEGLPPASGYWQQVALLTADVADALAEVHGAQLIHRDIKPENILIDAHGRPRLVDFGLATDVGASAQTIGAGTVGWASPSAMAGRAEPSTDLHSLGKVLAFLMTGERPMLTGGMTTRTWTDPAWERAPGLRDLAKELIAEHEQHGGTVAQRLRTIVARSRVPEPDRSPIRMTHSKTLVLPVTDAVADACWLDTDVAGQLVVAAGPTIVALARTTDEWRPLWQLAAGGTPQVVAAATVEPVVAWGIGHAICLAKVPTLGIPEATVSTGSMEQAGTVHVLAFHPNRRWLAAGRANDVVQIWGWDDGRGCELLATHTTSNDVRTCAWSHDGQTLIVGDDEGLCSAFSVSEVRGAVEMNLAWSESLSDGWFSDSYRYCTALHPHSGTIAMGGNDGGTLVTISAEDGRKTLTPFQRAGPIRGLAWLPNRQLLVATDLSGRISSWEPNGTHVRQELKLTKSGSAELMRLLTPSAQQTMLVIEGVSVFECEFK